MKYNHLMPVSPTRPTVKCLMMATIDGKIGSSNSTADVVDDYLDIYRDIDKSIAGNAWMCGRVTTQLYFAKEETTPLPKAVETTPPDTFMGDKDATRFYITIDTQGSLRFQNNYISFYPEHGNLHLVIIITKQTPKEYLSYLHDKGISYITCGDKEVDLALAMSTLKTAFAIETLLLEGGARINGSMLSAGLIDEIFLLTVPRVLNQPDAPSVFEDPTRTPVSITEFTLKKSEVRPRGCVLLHYTK